MEGKSKPRALFCFVEAGMGHIIPTRGVADVFERKYGDKVEVVRSYVFKESKSKAVNKMGAMQDSHPKNLGNSKIYRALESISYEFPSKFMLFWLDRAFGKGRKEFFNDLKEFDADLIFSTYYLPTHIAAQTNKKGLTNAIIASYAPDPYVYPAWDRECDVLFVTNEPTKKQAVRRGYKEEVVKVVPFVYRKEIIEGYLEKDKAREKLGLNKDGYILLYTAGAYGTKGTEKLINAIVQLDVEMQFVIVCGKNKEMYKSMCEIADKATGKTKIIPLGFVDNLNEYMSASDCAIGKSGLGTIMECKYHGLPLIIYSESSRVEKETAKYAVKEGFAIREHSAKKVVELIKKDTLEKGYLKGLLKDASVRPINGAEAVADELFKMLQNKFTELK
ncbi:MAG: glycosyltransferase [Clostridia bacterium]|nr:glycosyltransferase [Clostridia bacterium]